jgi:hypothetical protein
MKIVKNYEDINWKQCNIELFRLQSEILKAFKKGYCLACEQVYLIVKI